MYQPLKNLNHLTISAHLHHLKVFGQREGVATQGLHLRVFTVALKRLARSLSKPNLGAILTSCPAKMFPYSRVTPSTGISGTTPTSAYP